MSTGLADSTSAQMGVGVRHERRVLELGAVEVGDAVEAGEVERAGQVEHLGVGHVELGDDEVEDVRVDRLLDLEPHRRAESAALQLFLQCLEQVLGVVLLDLEVLVAGHAERVVLRAPPCPGTAGRGVRAMTSSSGTNRWSPTLTNRGKIGGTLTRAKCSLPVSGLRMRHGQVERQPGDVRERVRRVDRERGQHGEDPLGEEVVIWPSARPRSSSSQRSSWMPCVAERREDVIAEHLAVPLHQLARLAPDRLEQLAWHHAAGGLDGDAGREPALQARDPHHEELVEVAREDREEARALEQRQVCVLGQLEHPAVEPQPGELAVEEPVVGQVVVAPARTAARRRRRCRLRVERSLARARRRSCGRSCTGRATIGDVVATRSWVSGRGRQTCRHALTRG